MADSSLRESACGSQRAILAQQAAGSKTCGLFVFGHRELKRGPVAFFFFGHARREDHGTSIHL